MSSTVCTGGMDSSGIGEKNKQEELEGRGKRQDEL